MAEDGHKLHMRLAGRIMGLHTRIQIQMARMIRMPARIGTQMRQMAGIRLMATRIRLQIRMATRIGLQTGGGLGSRSGWPGGLGPTSGWSEGLGSRSG